jgi:hypothetical protein
VRSAFAAAVQMVYLDERRMGAARYGTTAAVAPQDFAADRRRDGLRGSRARAGLGIGGADVLGIATGSLDDGGRDCNPLAASLLLAVAAASTDRHGDLIGGAALVT